MKQCTTCLKVLKNAEFKKNKRLLKTCNKCRERQKKYREKRRQRLLEEHNKKEIVEESETSDNDIDKTYIKCDIDSIPNTKLNNNIKLLYKLAMQKYGIKFFVDVKVSENEGLFSIQNIDAKEGNYDSAFITIDENIKWKQVKRRFEKIKDEGMSKTCTICLEDREYKICCNECGYDFCTYCMLNMIKAAGAPIDKCPCCRYTQPFDPTVNNCNHDIYYNDRVNMTEAI